MVSIKIDAVTLFFCFFYSIMSPLHDDLLAEPEEFDVVVKLENWKVNNCLNLHL